jgi:hypothetical protein
VRPGFDAASGTYQAEATVQLVVGITPAIRFRLRRSTLGAQDVMMMPLLRDEGTLAAPNGSDFQTGTHLDSGPLQIADTVKLKPWIRYTWVAEAQGGPEPGSTVPGRWSAPSDPVTLALTPPTAPVAVQNIVAAGAEVAAGVFEDVEITCEHPDTLNGGDFGSYVLRLIRTRPGEAPVSLGEKTLVGEGPFTVSGMDPSATADQVAADTSWRLVLVDPLGRASAPAEIVGVTPR